MRFVIYGAGGVGGVIASQLFLNNYDVVMIARGAHLDVVQREGLHFHTPEKEHILKIPAVAHPSALTFSSDDVVILTMKGQHTVAALEDLRAVAGDQVPVICCQNGVINEQMALRRFQNVYAMLVYLPAVLLDPGHIYCHAKSYKGVLDAGCFPSGTDALIEEVTATLEASGFSAKPTADVMRWKYGKLLLNLGNALQALCVNTDDNEDERKAVRKRLLAEAHDCFRAAGIDWSSRAEEKARRDGVMEQADIPGMPRGGGSTWQSVTRGTGNVEADYLNGEIVWLGRLHGIPTPANETLQILVNDLALKKGKPQAMTVAELCAKIEERASS